MRTVNRMLLRRRATALDSQDPYVRLRAVEKLAASGDADAVEPLIIALTDPTPEIRTLAAEALATISDAQAIEPLIDACLREKRWAVGQELTAALAAFEHEKLLAPLLAALGTEDTALQQAAASVLRRVVWESLDDAQRALVLVVQNEWDEVVGLGRSAVAPLRVTLINGTLQSKRRAAEALGGIGTAEAYQAVLSIVQDPTIAEAARSTAAWAMRSFAWDRVGDTDLAHSAIVLDNWDDLAKLGAAAHAPLAAALRAGNEKAARALADIGNQAAVDALAGVLEDQRQPLQVREAAAAGLVRVGDKRAALSLVPILSHPIWQIRVAAADALADMGQEPSDHATRMHFAIARRDWATVVSEGDSAIELLIETLSHREVCVDAARALASIGDRGRDAIARLMREPDLDAFVRDVVAAAIATHGDSGAAEPLLAMLEDPDVAVRVSAVHALERTGWQPETDSARAIYAIAHGRWDELPRLGRAALEPLLRMMADGMALHETADALKRILETGPTRASIPQLQRLARLADSDRPEQAGMPPDGADGPAPAFGAAARLAKAELNRRGIFV